MYNYQQSSIADYLIKLFPNITNTSHNNDIDAIAAKDLFTIWINEKNKTGKATYRRDPVTPIHKIDRMKKAGFIRMFGNEVEITDKGADVIKVMILGDQKSIFEDDDSIIDYNIALSQTQQPLKMAQKISQTTSDIWWKRFE